MNLTELIDTSNFILTEGSVVERIRRNPHLALNEHLANALLVYDDSGRKSLEEIYTDYISIGKEADIPILILTPTWRAGKERMEISGYLNRPVNEDNFKFLDSIRSRYGDYSQKIKIGGLTGCANDAYDPAQALSFEKAEQFHSWQLEKLYNAGVDFFIASTLPDLFEAAGIAKAMSKFGIPYIISFIVRKDGTLLDGRSLHNAVYFIDSIVDPKPSYYMLNCVHPSVAYAALKAEEPFLPVLKQRIIGIQANTSSKSPEELDGSVELHCEAPEAFAGGLFDLHNDFGFKILGGCCGTDDRHIRSIAERIYESRGRKSEVGNRKDS